MPVICGMECWCAEREKKKRCSSCQDFLHRNKTAIHILLNFQDLIRRGPNITVSSLHKSTDEHWWRLEIVFSVFFLFKNYIFIDGKLWFKCYLQTNVFSLNFLEYHVTFEWDFAFYQTWNPIRCSNSVRLGDSEHWVSCQISPSY